MSERLLRKVALAALNGAKIDAPGASAKDISLAIMEAHERGIVKGDDVTHLQSPHPEWILIGPVE